MRLILDSFVPITSQDELSFGVGRGGCMQKGAECERRNYIYGWDSQFIDSS